MKKHKMVFEGELLFKIKKMFKHAKETDDTAIELDTISIIDEYRKKFVNFAEKKNIDLETIA